MSNRKKAKINKSTWLLFSFILFIIATSLISEFFQNPSLNEQNANLYHSPLPPSFLSSLAKVSFSNRLTHVELERRSNEKKLGIWHLILPRKLFAKAETLENIVNSLSKIKIRKIINKDPINIDNFSLADPLVKIELTDSLFNRISFSLGIINPIDESAYITFSNKEYIYQIDMLPFSLHTLGLADFIESKIFSFSPTETKSLKVYQIGWGGHKSQKLTIQKQDNAWIDSQKIYLDSEKIMKYLSLLGEVKSVMILDKIPDSAQKAIDRYLDHPLYQIEIEEGDEVLRFEVSNLITTTISDLKINKKENVIVKASNREYPYLVDKKILTYFGQSSRDFKTKSLP